MHAYMKIYIYIMCLHVFCFFCFLFVFFFGVLANAEYVATSSSADDQILKSYAFTTDPPSF